MTSPRDHPASLPYRRLQQRTTVDEHRVNRVPAGHPRIAPWLAWNDASDFDAVVQAVLAVNPPLVLSLLTIWSIGGRFAR